MDLTLRRIEESDWAVARELRLRSLADAPDAFASTLADEQAFDESVWRARARSNAEGVATLGLFAVLNGVEVGCAVGVRKNEVVELNALWVAPEARGRNAGRALVEAVCAWAREREATSVELEVALTSHAAQALYRACGFETTAQPETTCGARRAPALRMRRLL